MVVHEPRDLGDPLLEHTFHFGKQAEVPLHRDHHITLPVNRWVRPLLDVRLFARDALAWAGPARILGIQVVQQPVFGVREQSQVRILEQLRRVMEGQIEDRFFETTPHESQIAVSQQRDR